MLEIKMYILYRLIILRSISSNYL